MKKLETHCNEIQVKDISINVKNSNSATAVFYAVAKEGIVTPITLEFRKQDEDYSLEMLGKANYDVIDIEVAVAQALERMLTGESYMTKNALFSAMFLGMGSKYSLEWYQVVIPARTNYN